MLRAGPMDVAVALIEREGKYLITQRLPEDSFGGYWEFPGGKVRPGEELEACLIREIHEELGILITVGPQLHVVEHRYPHRTIRLYCFLCCIEQGQPQTIQCSTWKWVDRGDLSHFQFPPASIRIIEVLQERASH